jgi:hypothetical protein
MGNQQRLSENLQGGQMFRKSQWVVLHFIISIACAQLAHAQVWIAAAGTIDPASISKASVTNGSVYVKTSSTATNNVILRFDILPAGNNAKPLLNPEGTSSALRELGVRYIDDGPNAHVVVKVRKQDKRTGAINTLCTWDSNNWPQAAGFQSLGGCEIYADFDWNLPDSNGNSWHYYWVEATLTQSPGGKAALGGMDLFYDVP